MTGGVNNVALEYRILGPLEVLADGRPVPVRAAKQRALLAALLVDAGSVVPTETLIARLWDEPPDGARNALQNYVLRLRRTLGSAGDTGPIRTCPRGYVIDVPEGALDLHRFDALTDRARAAVAAHAPERAAALLGEALALWRGEPLADVPSERLALEVVPALHERRLNALEARTEADFLLGRHADVLPRLRELTAAHPLQERFWAQRMLALYRSGRQSEALDCYSTVSALLGDELGVDPGAELWRLHQRILTGDPALSAPPPRGPRAKGNLPAETTTFVGREALLRKTRTLLESARLVTLTGPGGVGKTRLALRAAAEAAWQFPHGAWLADLAPLTEPRLLDRAVAEALRIPDQSLRPGTKVLVEHLRERRLLLVLDNCEHVAEAAAELVGTLLGAAPGLRVLATSRQGLRAPGEYLLPVPPLGVPRQRGAAPSLTRCEAVRLLADRAEACAPHFRITARNQEAVGGLCRRLDGIPLAIELAAVRLGTLSAEEILDRLDDRFRLLSATGPHHQRTLRGVVDWSHDLCDERERRLWAGVSVFSGGFDLAAAEAVCPDEPGDETVCCRDFGHESASCRGASWTEPARQDGSAAAGVIVGGPVREDVVDVLAALVHKSVLTVDTTGSPARYRMLETLRQYGQGRLAETGRQVPLRRRHSAYYGSMAATAAAQWCGPDEVAWLSRLRRESPNLRAALDFSVSGGGDATAGLEIAANLTRTRYWFFSSSLGEGRHWLTRALELTPGAPAPLRAGGLALAAWIALCQGDQPAAEHLLAEAVRLGGAVEDGVTPAVLAYMEGAFAFLVRGDAGSVALLARARDRFRAGGLVGDAHMATMMWAMAAAFLGERESALAAGREYAAEAEAHRAGWAHSWGLWGMGLAELRHGDAGRSLGLFRDSLRRQWAIGDRWGPVWGVEALAWATAATGDHGRAARLLGAAARLLRTTGVALTGLRPLHYAHIEAERLVRARLGEEAYTAAYEEGAGTRDPVRLALGGAAAVR
ncbi:BTAD domain-containing putative transcriptional regulator [Streptomyces sp. G44]|uniref:AfsR/SARP family transcriptional regulator n=1 Tax=Streptomyces sp. G44 TaxID=2807632 RepID=UPI0027DDF1CD|nr:BTAD domain-containing putative transcriptional regulator [Streptomyces sp. G44]